MSFNFCKVLRNTGYRKKKGKKNVLKKKGYEHQATERERATNTIAITKRQQIDQDKKKEKASAYIIYKKKQKKACCYILLNNETERGG